jgi:hypothetical protein
VSNYTFDGEALLIIPADAPVGGVVHVELGDMYSRWKNWVQIGNNAKYPKTFAILGGEPITATTFVTPYFFLQNGWKIRPYEADHVFEIEGALVPELGTRAIVSTLGSFNVVVRTILPLQSVTTLVDGGVGLTYPDGIETGVTMQQALRIMLAVAAGKSLITDLGGGAAEVIFRDTPDTKARVTATMAGSERTAVTLDGS